MSHELNDFGFTAMSFDDITSVLNQSTEQQIETTKDQYKEKLNSLSSIIIPLLNNLSKNPDREYIYWPNRVEKINEQLEKINRIMEM